MPLVWLCRDRALMGDLVLRGWLLWSGAAVAVVLVLLNAAGLLGVAL